MNQITRLQVEQHQIHVRVYKGFMSPLVAKFKLERLQEQIERLGGN